jgi:hypothetical protein
MKRFGLLIVLVALQVSCGTNGDTLQTDVLDSHGIDIPVLVSPDGRVTDPVTCNSLIDCDDADPCTTDKCDWSGYCVHGIAMTMPCDDANACTEEDTCTMDGICQGLATVVCDDDKLCTTDFCDPENGCMFEHSPDGTWCDDGDYCTDDDHCQTGKCTGLTSTCDDGNSCTADTCDQDTGECTYISQSNLPCDDLNACTNGDLCTDGECLSGTLVECDDGNICTHNSCVAAPADDGGGCKYLPEPGKTCDDSNPCSIDDKCTEEGICLGTAGNCDDDNPCTADFCDPVAGCQHDPATGAACDDDDPCTDEGICKLGFCEPGTIINCKDDVECTEDSCNEEGECLHLPSDLLCDDEAFCNGLEWCDLSEGCQLGTPPDVDDGIACTLDSCFEEMDLIQHIPQIDQCDDGHACTIDLCALETGCINTPKICEDNNPCTADSCHAESGECLFEPQGECCMVNSDCVDAQPCTGGYCVQESNACSFHPYLCDDYDPCTVDSCLESCQHEVLPDCTDECDKDQDCFFKQADKDLCMQPQCTPDEQTGAKVCSFPDKLCEDGNLCTYDLCHPSIGCYFPTIPACGLPCLSDQDCNDNDACSEDICVGGFCANEIDLCDDGLACTAGECNWQTGECQMFECPVCQCPVCDEDGDCDDGSLCTVDVCLGATEEEQGVCRHMQVLCTDGNPCTKDICMAKQGCLFISNSKCTGCHIDTDCNDGVGCTLDTCGDDAYCSHDWTCE